MYGRHERRSVPRRLLRLAAEARIMAVHRLPVTAPVRGELLQPQRRPIGAQDFQVPERHGSLDEVGSARIAFRAPHSLNQYSE